MKQRMSNGGFIVFQRFVYLAHSDQVERAFLNRWQQLSNHRVRSQFGLAPATFRDPACRGVVAPVSKREWIAAVRDLRCPVVNYSGRLPPLSFALNVRFDSVEIGRLAAAHLVERGYKTFAFVAEPASSFSAERREGFADALAAMGRELHHEFYFPVVASDPAEIDRDAARRVGRWLDSMGGGGFFCANDGVALRFLRALREVDPFSSDLFGCVGVDDTAEAPGSMEAVGLTSVRPAYEGLGSTAAEHLHAALEGGADGTSGRVTLVGGAILRERDSTGGFFCDDPVVVRLARRAAIEVEAGGAPSVSRLMESAGLPRRTVSERFKRARGESLREFVLGLRLRRAARLLRTTEATIAEIAQACGFNKHADLTERFHSAFGCPPREFRHRGISLPPSA
jgi:LacI family transcriptional regulator